MMKVKDLIKDLKQYDKYDNVVIACDEELNAIFEGFEVAQLDSEKRIVIYPLNGTAVEL